VRLEEEGKTGSRIRRQQQCHLVANTRVSAVRLEEVSGIRKEKKKEREAREKLLY